MMQMLVKYRDVKRVDPKIVEPKPVKQRTRAQIKRDQKKARERFIKARNAEIQYRRQLKQVAKQVGSIVKGMAPQGIVAAHATELTHALDRYSEMLRPWATAVAKRMLADVDNRDAQAWTKHSQEMGLELRREIRSAPTGETMRQLLGLQVDLITSIPREAGQRVHSLAQEALTTGRRASVIADDILRSGDIAAHRAETIARTEVARAASTLTEVRALSIGATQYIWRTANDGNVRELHRKLNGKVLSWNDPPIAGENGERANPGCIYNCRCFAEPIIPDDL